MTSSTTVAGVLIGGQSRRMGACKALLEFRGTSWVSRIVNATRAVADEVVLVGNTDLGAHQPVGAVQLRDEPDAAGPLAGLVSLLAYAGDRSALIVACDMPLITPAVLSRLLSALDAAVDAAAFRVADGDRVRFPCCAAFRPGVLVPARRELARSGSLRGLLRAIPCRMLDVAAPEARCLQSFNTPEDHANLRTM